MINFNSLIKTIWKAGKYTMNQMMMIHCVVFAVLVIQPFVDVLKNCAVIEDDNDNIVLLSAMYMIVWWMIVIIEE